MAAHKQFNQEHDWTTEIWKLFNFVPGEHTYQYDPARALGRRTPRFGLPNPARSPRTAHCPLAPFAALLLLNFFSSRPPTKSLLPPIAIQALFAGLCVATGSSLIHATSAESYRGIIQQAPPLGVLWVWSVVRMDLAWALPSLLAVGGIVWARGDKLFNA